MSGPICKSALRTIICPSLTNADLSRLGEECRRMLESGADHLHLDVMDGHFVPNLTFGHPVIQCLRDNLGPVPYFDMHMMVSNPRQWIKSMADAGANQYTYHLEAVEDHNGRIDVINEIKRYSMKVGVAIKPATSVEELFPYCSLIDQALVMTVEPGFGGQKFMQDMMPKVRQLRAKYPYLSIQVDGGIGPTTIDHCADAGANCIVSGSALTSCKDPKQMIATMRSIVDAKVTVGQH